MAPDPGEAVDHSADHPRPIKVLLSVGVEEMPSLLDRQHRRLAALDPERDSFMRPQSVACVATKKDLRFEGGVRKLG